MGEASIVEMITQVLPEIAQAVSAPLENVKSITMYGDQSGQLIQHNTEKIDKILKVAEDSLGINLKDMIATVAANRILKDNTKPGDIKGDN